MPRSDYRFAYRKRVHYPEIDAQAVVYNSRYLEYFDIALTEYWRAAGLYDRSPVSGGVEFHLAKATVEYKAPISLDEEIFICCRTQRIGNSSITVALEIHGLANGETGEDLRATGETIQVHVAEARGRPAPVPGWIVDLFEAYEGQTLQAKAAS
ncbi:acyl-CoA thioesterase [Sandaracinobacteroides hominis]|uniref:acyl-CoA thioesterase n=1 Tax=Sandaracinobacteroides hominis TaxID=2780086 RepID=UPI0018F78D38|nr:thioesterase family protein [Sandaracinobacteroides hominis]